jgi:glycosyltransferase involved in cell wall biosynthesis
MKVSTLILTYNEERNLARCLLALRWCEDVVVLDSGSQDRTTHIAREMGARVLRRPFDNFADQRNFGLERGSLRYQWVLHLDADEVVTPEFVAALNILSPEDGIDAYRVPSRIVFHEHWLRYASMYPTYQVRLGHRERLRFKLIGHGQREDLPPSRVGTFPEPYLHYSFSHGLAAWLSKHVKYAEDEAHLTCISAGAGSSETPNLLSTNSTERRRALKVLSGRLPLILRPAARFFYVFFWRRGFLDGRYGALYALMLSIYEGMIAAFTWDERLRGRRPRADARVPPNADLAGQSSQHDELGTKRD